MRRLDQSQADASSWCSGWLVRDVLGHLVHLAEATQIRMLGDVLRYGPAPDRALDRRARDLGKRPVAELADRLENARGGRYHVLGTPSVVALGEVLVHGCDMKRSVGETDQIEPEVVVPVLKTYKRIGGLAFHARPAAKVTLTATDESVSLGTGPVVNGRAIDLLLLLANRRQVMPSPSGPGVAALEQ